MTKVSVHVDKEALALAAARHVVMVAQNATAARGKFTIALAGGTTPRGCYLLLAGHPFREEIDWRRVEIFFGDERCVPPDHPDSNFRMARDALLSKVSVPAAQVHRMQGERDDLGVVAREYAATLCRVLGGNESDPPRLDLVLLGLGDDGHTASIFPDTLPLTRGPALVARVKPAVKPEWRLTLTLPVLNAAREVAFLVSGASKSGVVKRIIEESGGEPRLPAALVKPGEAKWMLDRDAAGELTA